MNTKVPPLSRFMQVDTSASRMRRLWLSVERRLGTVPRSHRRPLLALVASIGFVVGALTVYASLTWSSRARVMNSGTILETANDQLTVEVGPGATLRLAARTRVVLGAVDARTSSLRLQHGTITCDVTSQHRHRFSVLVDDLEVRDTGTRFSVGRDSRTGEIDVHVERGSVQILWAAGNKEGKSLAAGEHWLRQGMRPPEALSAPQPTGATAIQRTDGDAGSLAGSNRDAKPASEATRDTAEGLSASSLFEQASASRRAGNPAEAGRALQTLITRYPNDTRVGLAALELGRLRLGPLADIPGAVRAFRLALAHAPNAGFREDALAHLVEAHSALGDVAQCVALRHRYLDEYPKGIHRTTVERKCQKP